MFKIKKILVAGLLLLAVSNFIDLSLGGEFLHSRIHHHSDQSSQEECFIHQLQVQVFTALAVIFAAPLLNFQFKPLPKSLRKIFY